MFSRDTEAGLARIGFARKNDQNYQPQCHITYIVFLDSWLSIISKSVDM